MTMALSRLRGLSRRSKALLWSVVDAYGCIEMVDNLGVEPEKIRFDGFG